MAETVLDLSTTPKRAAVNIDGERYEMRHPDELAFVDMARLIDLQDEAAELVKDTDEGKSGLAVNAERLDAVTAESVNHVLVDVPAKVVAKIRPNMTVRIMEAFNAQGENPTESTGDDASKPSPGARDSTGASGD